MHNNYSSFIKIINPMNPQNIRPKKLNIKEFMRLIEEIYSYKFDRKSVNGAAETGPI
jgi:hypothetical protein